MRTGWKVKVTWNNLLDSTTSTWNGTVIDMAAGVARIAYEGEGEIHSLPPKNEGILIQEIIIMSIHSHPAVPAITRASTEIYDDYRVVIYCDGGAAPNPGAAAAAIVVWKITPDSTTEANQGTETTHARFFPRTTNNATELAALIAGMRVAIGCSERTLLLTDSEFAMEIANGRKRIRKAHQLRVLAATARDIYMELQPNVTVAHTLREGVKQADAAVRACRTAGRNMADDDLFPHIDDSRAKTAKEAEPIATAVHKSTFAKVKIDSLADFGRHRAFKARGTVPTHAAGKWAVITKQSLVQIFTATSHATKFDALMDFLLLPNRYLPCHVAVRRIEQHLGRGEPFSMEINKTTSTQVRSGRLSNAVHRAAADRKLRTAISLLDQTATEIPFDIKLQKIKAKICEIDDTLPQYDNAPTYVAPFSAEETAAAMKAQNRQSSTAIDWWTKDLINTAIAHDPTIRDDVAHLLTLIAERQFGTLGTEILRATRAVAIPKADAPDDVRPIGISSLWMKLVGTIMAKRSGTRVSRHQYAINSPNGCTQMFHKIKDQYIAHGATIIRLDISNAFNSASRRRIMQLLSRDKSDPLIAYFKTAYDDNTTIAYGPEGRMELIKFQEGIHQGDATSALLFCVLMDEIIQHILNKVPEVVRVFTYMDDITITCPPGLATEAEAAAFDAIETFGMKVNVRKSKILSHEAVACQCQLADPMASFVVVGANLTENYDEYIHKYHARIDAFFNKLSKVELHPALLFTIARICGNPIIKFMTNVTEPGWSMHIAKYFEVRIKKFIEELCGATIDDVMLHDRLGAGVPDYCSHLSELYNLSQNAAITNTKMPEVELVTNVLATAPLRSQHAADWLFFNPTALMEPPVFALALAMRLRAVPPSLKVVPIQCGCGYTCTDSDDLILHCLRCDKFSTYTRTHRHNLLRDTLINVARRYGIACTPEPTFYSYDVPEKKRPDITFHTPTPVVTDVTIVFPQAEVGIAAADAAVKKRKEHTIAVNNASHIFVPAAFEIFGHADKSFYDLTSTLLQSIPRALQYAFKRDFTYAASTALATGRAATLLSAIRQSNVNFK